MRFASAVSTAVRAESALEAVSASITEQLRGPATWAAVFASPHHEVAYPTLPGRLREALGGPLVFGCSAGGVIGAGCEVEGAPGLSVVAAHMPDAELHPFAVDPETLPAPDDDPEAWVERIGLDPDAARGLLLFPDPYTVDTQAVLRSLDAAYPGVPVLGGQVSGGRREGGQGLFLGSRVAESGLVGVGFSGDVHVQAVVAQGCRPIGAPMFVTRCERNRILELDGRDPLDVLRDVWDELDAADRELFQRNLFLGVQMQDQTEYAQGDFLIRHIHGVPEGERALAVAMRPERFQVVQLHVRDAQTSADDLRTMLRRWASSPDARPPVGALLFQCLGRGAGLYGEPDHDARVFLSELGSVPMGGFFANGELGPVHGRTHLHGYTSVFALFS